MGLSISIGIRSAREALAILRQLKKIGGTASWDVESIDHQSLIGELPDGSSITTVVDKRKFILISWPRNKEIKIPFEKVTVFSVGGNPNQDLKQETGFFGPIGFWE